MTRFLLLGIGGGYDIYGGIPLYWRLTNRGHQVFLANISFTDDLHQLCVDEKKQFFVKVTGEEELTKKNQDYFPEYHLARYLQQPVFAIRLMGWSCVHAALKEIVQTHDINHIVAIDNGFDSLLMGDEAPHQRGSPLEDCNSLLALNLLYQEIPIDMTMACISVPTETMDLELFYSHWNDMQKANPNGTKTWLLKPERWVNEYKALLDATTNQSNRSIPSECLLAALEGHRGKCFQNPRLAERITHPEDFPPVTDDTARYFLIDLIWFMRYSPFFQILMEQTKAVHSEEIRVLQQYITKAFDTTSKQHEEHD